MLCVVGFKLVGSGGTARRRRKHGLTRAAGAAAAAGAPPHADGAAPAEGACPLCGASPAAAPAAPACSGYVCCHACLTAHIREHGACPVTLLPARLEDIRKLFSE